MDSLSTEEETQNMQLSLQDLSPVCQVYFSVLIFILRLCVYMSVCCIKQEYLSFVQDISGVMYIVFYFTYYYYFEFFGCAMWHVGS